MPFIGHTYQAHLLMHMRMLSTVCTAHAQGRYMVQNGHEWNHESKLGVVAIVIKMTKK